MDNYVSLNETIAAGKKHDRNETDEEVSRMMQENDHEDDGANRNKNTNKKSNKKK